jgi:hypothetical protein
MCVTFVKEISNQTSGFFVFITQTKLKRLAANRRIRIYVICLLPLSVRFLIDCLFSMKICIQINYALSFLSNYVNIFHVFFVLFDEKIKEEVDISKNAC